MHSWGGCTTKKPQGKADYNVSYELDSTLACTVWGDVSRGLSQLHTP